MAAAPGKDSLVKYDTPSLITTKTKRAKIAVPKLDRKSALPATEDILNAILPPREWKTDDGQLWVQHVSSTPATRIDVMNLQVRRGVGGWGGGRSSLYAFLDSCCSPPFGLLWLLEWSRSKLAYFLLGLLDRAPTHTPSAIVCVAARPCRNSST
jgi:hypothetical protein